MENVIAVEVRGQTAIVRVVGDLDMATAPAFRRETVAAIAAGATHVVVDLTPTDHVDSVGVGLLLGVLKRVRTHDGSVRVVCDEDRIRRVLELTELTTIIPVVDRLSDAMADTAAQGE